MSLAVPTCKNCGAEATCDVVAWFSNADRNNFAVAWRCEACGPVTLVVSPIGPQRVSPDTCVHCGHAPMSADQPCPTCGFSIGDILTAADRSRPDDELMDRALQDFARGTCRRGLSIVNYVLRRNPDHPVARGVWEQFVAHLEANGSFAAQYDGTR